MLRQLTADAKLRDTTNSDGTHLYSLLDFIKLACAVSEYNARHYYLALTSNPKYTNEILRNVTMMQLRQAVDDTHIQTPGMTVERLQRLLLILGNEVVGDFRKMLADICNRR